MELDDCLNVPECSQTMFLHECNLILGTIISIYMEFKRFFVGIEKKLECLRTSVALARKRVQKHG